MDSGLSKSAAGYDRLSRWYQPLEWLLFRGHLQRSRLALVDRIPNVTECLVLGDGDGRLLRRLVERHRRCRFLSIDQSGRMLDRQRQRIADADRQRVDFLQIDARCYEPRGRTFDLLVAPFFLDCFSADQLCDALPRWLETVRTGGYFYFVDFIEPEPGWRRLQSGIYQSLMHRFFRWQTGLPNRTLVDLDRQLAPLPIRRLATASDLHPLMTCRLYQKMESPLNTTTSPKSAHGTRTK